MTSNHERQVLTLPRERQIASDAFTSGQLTDDNKRWLASHANPCDPRLQRGEMWPERLGADVALCCGSPRSDIEYLMETPMPTTRWLKRRTATGPASRSARPTALNRWRG